MERSLTKKQFLTILAFITAVEKDFLAQIYDFFVNLVKEELVLNGTFHIPGVVILRREYIPYRYPLKTIINGKWHRMKEKQPTYKISAKAFKKFKTRVL